jgi:hypothetical protein
MKKAIFHVIVALAAALGVNGCMSMNWGTRPYVNSIYVSEGTVYAAGFSAAGSSIVPCYWVNGLRADLPVRDGSGSAREILVSNGTLYVVGSSGGVPCFWANGVRTDLPTEGKDGVASSVFVTGDTAYIAGSIHQSLLQWSPCYWVNAARVDLDDNGLTNSIFVSENTVYATGMRHGIACSWVNGVGTDLKCEGPILSQSGSSIKVSGGTVYIAGGYQSRSAIAQSLLGPKYVACYWKDGARTDLPGENAMGAGSCLVGNTFYVAGSYDYRKAEPPFMDAIPCYWTNNIRTDLSGGRGWASSIFISEGTVYVAGNLKDGACYWVNGQKVDLR